MLKGYAVKIELIRWEKHPDRDAAFETISSHYVGSLGTEEKAAAIFQRLSGALEREIVVQDMERENKE